VVNLRHFPLYPREKEHPLSIEEEAGWAPEPKWTVERKENYDIFVNCNWVATRWQKYSTHIHTNNTQNDTKQTIYRTTQKLRRVRAVPRLCGFYPGICLTTGEKAWKNLSQGSHT
jgi:hypothetical protein